MRILVRLRPASSAVVACLQLNLGGCGESDGLPREAVSGTVSVEGKPLKTGLITFLPASPETTTQGGGPVVEGKYSMTRSQGIVPGKYKVIISSPEDTPEKFPDAGRNNDAPGMPPIPAKEVIPAQYNNKSLLTADVVEGGKNVFDFNLTAKPPGK